MRLKNKTKRRLKPLLAILLAFLSAFGTIPLNVFASETTPQDPVPIIEGEPFITRIDGEDVLVPADGIALVQVAGFDTPMEMEIPRYIYFDGERIYMDDDRIENISPVVVPFAPFGFDSSQTANSPSIGFIVSLSGTLPSNPVVGEIGQEFTHPVFCKIKV